VLQESHFATEMDKITVSILDLLESESKFPLFRSCKCDLQEGIFEMQF